MQYDFATYIPRGEQGSSKWLDMKRKKPDVPEDVVPFSVADMEFKTAPEIIRGLQDYLPKTVLGYTQETEAYLAAVCGWMARRHGWKVRPEWVVTSPGVVTALALCVKAFTQPGDGVIVMTPVYYPFYRVVRGTGRTLQENGLVRENGRYGIDFEGLEALAREKETRMLILCSPHNPVGRVWTKEELVRVGEICARHGVLVVSDEIHNDLIMPGYFHTVFSQAGSGFAEHTVVCTAPSKTFNLAGMQTSNIIIENEALRKRFLQEKRANAVMELNALGYKACEIAYTKCEGWLDELLGVVDENRALVERFLDERLPPACAAPLEGTYLQWLDFRWMGLSIERLEERMHAENLFFDEGYIFGAAGAGFERLNLACPKSVLEKALVRLEKAVRQG